MHSKNTIVIAAMAILISAAICVLTPEQLSNLKFKRSQHYAIIYRDKVEQLGSLTPTLNTRQQKVSGMIQIVTYDLFLEIEHACLKNFDFVYCKQTIDAIVAKFLGMNVVLQEDYEFLQAAIETILYTPFMDPLYSVLLENNLLDTAFEKASVLKSEIEDQFMK